MIWLQSGLEDFYNYSIMSSRCPVPSGLAGAGNERTPPESTCLPSDRIPLPAWCLALAPPPAYDSSLQGNQIAAPVRTTLKSLGAHSPTGPPPVNSVIAKFKVMHM